MKKLIIVLFALVSLSGCVSHCETEPIVQENQKLIVPPHFGQRPA